MVGDSGWIPEERGAGRREQLQRHEAAVWLSPSYSVTKSLRHGWLICSPMDCSPRGFSVHGISQARILQWVAILFSRDLPTQGSNLSFLHRQVDSSPPSHLGSPSFWVPSTVLSGSSEMAIYGCTPILSFKFFFFFCCTAGSLWDLSSPTGDQTQDLSSPLRVKLKPPALEVWSLNHWTTREVPHSSTFSPSLQGPALQPLISSQVKQSQGRRQRFAKSWTPIMRTGCWGVRTGPFPNFWAILIASRALKGPTTTPTTVGK